MKLNVTILEDEATHAAQLKQLLEKWGKQNNISTSIRHYFNDKDFSEKEFLDKMSKILAYQSKKKANRVYKKKIKKLCESL